ncbi:MAG: hypothetical protein JW783_05205 [Bacteroidales bacterium]|nr:hypothetical protein [Bacteroidales bacterium]MBN2749373.1 hypothetical protein [Bacteroidales bacterium]
MSRLYLISTSILLLVCIGCKRTPSDAERCTTNSSSVTGGAVIADSLIYDVIIRALDPDNEWENIRVKGIDRKAFVQGVFDAIYTGKYYAYDFFTQEPISIDSVRAIENKPNFTIDQVSKVQFTEHWELLETGELIKRVDAMTLGIEHYSNQGTFIGHKALFTVKLKRK